MTGLALVVVFRLFPVHFDKVDMRQPCPEVTTFFLWSLLLARIGLLRTAGERRLPASGSP